jgi:peptide/nickel transport system substrate-binding protein
MVGLPARFDPHDQVLPNDFGVRVAFDSLLLPDERGGLALSLAESYRPVGETVWEFVLRPDLRFASGRPVTAESVCWNFDRVKRNFNLATSQRLNTYAGAQAVDQRIIRFQTLEPDPIWPRRALQIAIGDPEEAIDGEFGANPGPLSGTGLYRIVEYDPGKRLRLEASPDSWRGRANVPALEMRPYDPAALEAAFLAGEVHVGYLDEPATDRLMAATDLVLQRTLQANVHTIRFNSLKRPFDDPRIREALALAIDQRAIQRTVYRGHGWAANQIVGADCYGFDPDLPPSPHDPARAGQLLRESGFTGTLKFDVLAASAVIRPWCEAVMAQLRAVGFSVEPVYVDMPTYLAKMVKNNPPRSDLIGAGNQYGPGLDADFALNKFSNRLPASQVEYSDRAFQALYDASLTEFDPAKREILLRRCAQRLMADSACVPIWQPALGWLVSPRVKGLKMNTLGLGWVDWRDITME